MGGAEAHDDDLVKEENLVSMSKVAAVAAAAAGDGIVDIAVQSPPANQSFSSSSSSSIGPVTPDSNREICGEQHHHGFSSPLTGTTGTKDDNDSSSQTPKETLFDSFAPPGSDDKLLLFAPHHNKYKFVREEGSRVNVVRSLNFADVTITRHEESTIPKEEEEEEEKLLFQIVYDAIVDAIVSEQQEQEQQTKQQQQELGGDDVPRTPPKTYLGGIVETPCPAAPIKSTTKYSRINLLDKEICKRLEF